MECKENLSLVMDKWELSVVDLSEVQWPRKGEIPLFSGNYTMFYWGGFIAEKGVTIVMRNYII